MIREEFTAGNADFCKWCTLCLPSCTLHVTGLLEIWKYQRMKSLNATGCILKKAPLWFLHPWRLCDDFWGSRSVQNTVKHTLLWWRTIFFTNIVTSCFCGCLCDCGMLREGVKNPRHGNFPWRGGRGGTPLSVTFFPLVSGKNSVPNGGYPPFR